MGRLTPGERRRVFLAQERMRQAMRAKLSTTRAVAIDRDRAGYGWLHGLVMMAMILALFTGGLLASEFVELHLPASLIEALLPRL